MDFVTQVLGLSSKKARPGQLSAAAFGGLVTKTCEYIRIVFGSDRWVGGKNCSKCQESELVCDGCSVSFSRGENEFRISASYDSADIGIR